MSYIEDKYINLLSSQLEKFAKKSSVYEFRCPYCGDSKKSKSKARGYFYKIKENTNFKCHNCGKSISFKNFLKDMDVSLFEQYVFEKFKTGTDKNLKLVPEVKVEPKKKLKKHFNLPSISELNKEHFARKYIEELRQIPEKYLDTLYFCENFKEWTNSQKETFNEKSLKFEESRIIIPLTIEGEIFGFQGRSLQKNSKVKYITIILDQSKPKIYGLDSIDWNKNVYIVEGPFDSMFLPNSLAMVGADLNSNDLPKNKDIDYIFVYDNERRNKQIVDRMEKTIDMGYSIVIWPLDLKDKDINAMVLEGINPVEVIKQNTFKGLQAKAKLINWKRV